MVEKPKRRSPILGNDPEAIRLRRERKNEYTAAWRLNNPEASKVISARCYKKTKKARRAKYFASRYNDAEIYDKLFLAQSGMCAICQTPTPRKGFFMVDHCHATSKVRGLLCSRCNTSLGWFKDDTVLMERALMYLRRNAMEHIERNNLTCT